MQKRGLSTFDRPQFVRMGTVVACLNRWYVTQEHFLFTILIYTLDFQYNTESWHLQKFFDHSAVVRSIKDGQGDQGVGGGP